MRKVISGMLAAVLAIGGGAHCVRAEEFDYETEFQYMYNSGDWNVQSVTRGNEGYYIRLTDVLFYADESLEMAIPLCSRPECLHQKEPTLRERRLCDAYLGTATESEAIQYYDGKIYTVSDWDFNNGKPYSDRADRVYSISSDGLVREEQDVQLGLRSSPILHRGYYYYFYFLNQEQEDGNVKRSICLARKEISGGEEELIYSTAEFDSYSSLLAYRDYVYFVYWNGDSCYTLVYHIADGEISFLDPGQGTRPVFAFEDDHLLVTYLGLEEESQPIWITDLDGENAVELTGIQVEPGWTVGSDGQYLYMENGTTWGAILRQEPRVIRYYDRETLEYIGEVDLGLNVGSASIAFGDENYLFYRNCPEGNTDIVQLMYIRKDEMAAGNAESHLLLEGEKYNMSWSSEWE